MTKLAVALGFLALNFYVYHYFATDEVIPPREHFATFPLEFDGGWLCNAPQKMDKEVEENLGVTDYLICDYKNREREQIVNVYVGYHQTQVREEGGGSAENSIHPPAHCLPGSGWDIIHNAVVPLHVASATQPEAPVRRLIIAKGKARQLVYYWYQSRGRVISQDWEKILFVGFDRATRRRTDGSLIRFTIPIFHGDEDRAEAAFHSLAPGLLAALPAYVPN